MSTYLSTSVSTVVSFSSLVFLLISMPTSCSAAVEGSSNDAWKHTRAQKIEQKAVVAARNFYAQHRAIFDKQTMRREPMDSNGDMTSQPIYAAAAAAQAVVKRRKEQQEQATKDIKWAEPRGSQKSPNIRSGRLGESTGHVADEEDAEVTKITNPQKSPNLRSRRLPVSADQNPVTALDMDELTRELMTVRNSRIKKSLKKFEIQSPFACKKEDFEIDSDDGSTTREEIKQLAVNQRPPSPWNHSTPFSTPRMDQVMPQLDPTRLGIAARPNTARRRIMGPRPGAISTSESDSDSVDVCGGKLIAAPEQSSRESSVGASPSGASQQGSYPTTPSPSDRRISTASSASSGMSSDDSSSRRKSKKSKSKRRSKEERRRLRGAAAEDGGNWDPSAPGLREKTPRPGAEGVSMFGRSPGQDVRHLAAEELNSTSADSLQAAATSLAASVRLSEVIERSPPGGSGTGRRLQALKLLEPANDELRKANDELRKVGSSPLPFDPFSKTKLTAIPLGAPVLERRRQQPSPPVGASPNRDGSRASPNRTRRSLSVSGGVSRKQ